MSYTIASKMERKKNVKNCPCVVPIKEKQRESMENQQKKIIAVSLDVGSPFHKNEEKEVEDWFHGQTRRA